MSLAFLFPGQGSQAVGMGADLAEAFASAREVFQEVDDALGQKLFKLMKEGPEDQLTLTENAQPALMAVSLAVSRTLEKEFKIGVDRAAFVAGHSLGEYSALAAAAFSSKYFTLFVPGMGNKSSPCANTQAKASCAGVQFFSRANCLIFSTRSKFFWKFSP